MKTATLPRNSKATTNSTKAATPLVRCAIYTRKSTEEGLKQEFNSLDAQRDAGEAYVASQQHEGWICLPERYDDGGFTGGNMDRPALERLLADIAAGQGRPLVALAHGLRPPDGGVREAQSVVRLRHAAVQHRYVDGPAGAQRAAVLHPIRTRDHLRTDEGQDRGQPAQGKWAGVMPLLGYDVDPHGGRLLVNAAEVVRVRAIFELYLQHGALLPVVQELERRGWRTKRWTTRGASSAVMMPPTPSATKAVCWSCAAQAPSSKEMARA